jgi:Kef-type K+ transport system membrane component KefB
VVDDVLGLIILAVASGIVKSGSISLSSAASITALSLGFLIASVAVGLWSAPKVGAYVSRMQVEGMKIITAFLFMLAMSYAATLIGLSSIVGAFAAGLVLDDVIFKIKKEYHIEALVKPLYCVFVPIFFVLMGTEVDLAGFLNPQVIAIAIGITLAAVIGKQVCGLGVIAAPKRTAPRSASA